ncbi:Cystathionine beta-lyase PatB [Porphyromonas macacae]|uniref:cysteine-S-conjugate beta-lyase n=1 Tax=Porphyromonas macacae TaxID=28115 RepID=A0A379E7N0_9PORP|nr:MalY/PatB family protein [Porphyromonas macacae]SUB88311.1 Cystathionine beta-lyase PatB [Porphyromonas macacae]
MKYNFDTVIDRHNTNSVKYDDLQARWGRTDLLPMWVADADMASCPIVIDKLKERLEYPVLGYSLEPEGWRSAIQAWLSRRYHWKIEKEELMFIPGIVRGIAFILVHFCKPGDKVAMLSPVYMPFFDVPKAYDIEVVQRPLKLVDGRYEVDFELLDRDTRDAKFFILSNPHNPGGRVWTPGELRRMAEICSKNNCIVISDEIHADLTLPGHVHTPFASVSNTARDNSISFLSPSKAFNIPDLTSSYVVIPNKEIRRSFERFMTGGEFNIGYLFAYLAVEAAYTPEGEEWLNEFLQYIQANIDYAVDCIHRNIPGIVPMRPEASFLIFLDCRGLGLDADGINRLFVEDARLALNDGRSFGPGGEGFMRMNVACPRATLEKALKNLAKAVSDFNK